MRDQVEGVTFGNFAAIAKIKHWTVEELAAEFRGIAEKSPPQLASPAYFAEIQTGQS